MLFLAVLINRPIVDIIQSFWQDNMNIFLAIMIDKKVPYLNVGIVIFNLFPIFPEFSNIIKSIFILFFLSIGIHTIIYALGNIPNNDIPPIIRTCSQNPMVVIAS